MWHNSWGEKPWQYDDKYLVALTNELNSSCEKQKELKELKKAKKSDANLEKIKYLDSNCTEWDPDDLNYDFKECRKYCYTDTDCYRWDEEKLLCNSCKKLLDEKLRIPYNKTSIEIGQEFQVLNNRIEELEKCLKRIQSKLECQKTDNE